jgi:hypothetical protein
MFMKFLLPVVFVVALVAANEDGDFCGGSASCVPNPGTDQISLTLVNDWTLSGKALGLDVFFTMAGAIILGADNNLNIVQAYNSSGVPQASLSLNSSNGSCFGVSWNNDVRNDFYLTNDWDNGSLFHTENFGGTWTYFTNPAGTNGRGMDFDGTNYWETNGPGGGVWRFVPGGSQENIPLAEPPGNTSGLTVFSTGTNSCLAITCYTTHNFYFYSWDGSSMTYLGSAPCPVSGITSSFGLAYNDYNGNMLWSYKKGSVYHLAEFSFTITSLSRSSWGSIKTSF